MISLADCWLQTLKVVAAQCLRDNCTVVGRFGPGWFGLGCFGPGRFTQQLAKGTLVLVTLVVVTEGYK